MFTDLVLGTTSFSLGLKFDFSLLFHLFFVDGFDENVLVLVEVTFSAHVESVVHVSVDFLGVSITTEESTEDSLSAHPDELGRHTCVPGSLSATSSGVTATSLGSVPSLAARAGVDVHLSSHDEVVFRELANVFTGISKSHFASLVGVNPDTFLTALKN